MSRGQLEHPRIAFVRGPVWRHAEPDAAEALMAFVQAERLPELVLPGEFDDVIACHARILAAHLAANFGEILASEPEKLRDITRARIEVGLPIAAAEYIRSVHHSIKLMEIFERLMRDHDAVVTLAAPGQAPRGLGSTGDPVFCATWTLLGVPTISVPLLRGADDLPIGLQVIGRRGGDEVVMQAARWLERRHTG